MPGNAEQTTSAAALSDALYDFFRAARRARGRAAGRASDDGLSLAQCHLLEPLADGPLTKRQPADHVFALNQNIRPGGGSGPHPRS